MELNKSERALKNTMKVARRILLGDPGRLKLIPPEPAAGRHGIALVIIVKDESRHLKDWLTFHALAGVRTAIIYDNGSTDETVEIAKGFKGMETHVVPWVVDVSLGPMPLKTQTLAYAHAICTFGKSFRWMGFLDIDEYLVPVSELTIPEVLSGFEDVTNLSLPWTMFGPNGHRETPEMPAVMAYTERAAHRLRSFTNFKCIVDPCDVTLVRVHKFETRSMGSSTVNDRHERVTGYKARTTEKFASSERLQLNHYFTFSHQELERKLSRKAVSGRDKEGRSDYVHKVLSEVESDVVEDRTAPDFLARYDIHTTAQFRSLFS